MKKIGKINKEIKMRESVLMGLFLFVLIVCMNSQINAQELYPSVVSSSGETFTVNAYSLDFVIGEISTESYTKNGFMISQGFLQGNEGGLAIQEYAICEDDIDIFPNPTSDLIYVVSKAKEKPKSIEIYDLQSCILVSKQVNTESMRYSLRHMSSGVYIMRIIFPDCSFVNKKIIKK